MGNYSDVTNVIDAAYGLYNAIDDNDKNLINTAQFYKLVTSTKSLDDAGPGSATLDYPILYSGAPFSILAIVFYNRLSIPANVADYVTFSVKRYTNGALVEILAELKTDVHSVSAYQPALLLQQPNTTYTLGANDMLVASIAKTGAGQLVGAGTWHVVVKPI